jgi:hypothetical protein
MARMVKRTVQKPEEIRESRERLLSMERFINAGLKLIDPAYRIRDLVRRPDGTFEFGSDVEFDAAHRPRIEHLFSVLEAQDTEFIQVKYYLPREVQRRVRHLAIDSDLPASAIVGAILAENI